MTRKRSLPYCLIFLGLVSYSGAQAVADSRGARWNQTVPLNPQDPCLPVPGSVESRGVAIGPDQDPVAVGEVTGLSRVVVVKYDGRSGEQLWCKSFPVRATAANGTTFLVPFAEVGGVAIDSNGTIFIAGDGGTAPYPPPPQPRPGPPPPLPTNRYFVTKCSSVGACNSTVTFIEPSVGGSHNDTIGGIAIGPDGNPVLTGVATIPSPFPRPSTFKLVTVKVDGSRFRLLRQAQVPSNPPSMTSRVGVAVDSRNDIFVTGTEASTSKYDSLLSPTPLWTKRLAGARIATRSYRHRADEWEDRKRGVWDDDEHATATHGRGANGHDENGSEAGDVAVVRTVANATNTTQDLEVTMLDGETGNTLRTTIYDSGFNDIPRDIALDSVGDILVAGDRSGQRGQPVSPFQEGQLVSLSRTGKLNWVAVFPTRRATGDISKLSFFAVAVGSDSAPVVSGYSEVPPAGPMRVMRTIKYTFHHAEPSSDEGSDRGEGLGDKKLAWDEATSQTVNGFRVCIDAEPVTACQDVGKPKSHTLPSTTEGSLAYEIPLAALRSLTKGTHTILVMAYNASGDSVDNPQLIVEIERLR